MSLLRTRVLWVIEKDGMPLRLPKNPDCVSYGYKSFIYQSKAGGYRELERIGKKWNVNNLKVVRYAPEA